MKNEHNSVFRGAATALITPFDHGKPDLGSLERLIEFQISEGIDALLVCGTTGESATLSEKERRELISFAIDTVGGRVPLIAGTGSNDTKSAARLSKYASDAGADALLCVTPYYNKASNDGIISHYRAISESVNVPIIVYNVPSRTGLNIPAHIYAELTGLEWIRGVKEASGSLSYAADIACATSGALDIYSGNDDLTVPLLSVGGCGVFSVVSNIVPGKVAEMCRAYERGESARAAQMQLELIPLIRALFSEVNPIPIKALLAEYGMCHEEYRLPLCKMSPDARASLISLAEGYI